MKLQNKLTIALLLFLSTISCTKKIEKNVEPDLTLTGKAAPVVSGHWRKMGDFFNAKCIPRYVFTIGDKAYFTVSGSSSLASSFWEYSPVTNTFTPKANVPGQPSGDYKSFGLTLNKVMNGKGYSRVVWSDYSGNYPEKNNRIWEYDPSSDHWTRKADMFADTLAPIGAFAVNNLCYITGWQYPDGYKRANTYSYNPQTDEWKNQNTGFSGSTYSITNIAFAIANKGYMVHWTNNFDALQTSEFDPAANTWNKIADFPKQFNAGHIPSEVPYSTYTLNNKGYVYCGSAEVDTKIVDNRIFEFTPSTHQWQSLGDFDGPARSLSFAFTIGSKAYIGFGHSYVDGTDYMDIWEYNP